MTNHMDIDSIRSLAEVIRRPSPSADPSDVTLLHGIVVGFGAGTVSVLLRGSIQNSLEMQGAQNLPAVGIRFLKSYKPILGDNVWVLKQGANSLVLGPVQTAEGLLGLENYLVVGSGDTSGYQNGWQAWDEPTYAGARYWKDPDGWVELEGMISNPTAASASSVMFTLEEGYRPHYTQYLNAVKSAASGLSVEIWRIKIDTNGEVRADTDSSGSTSHKLWVSLGGLRFMAAPPGGPYDRVHEWTPFEDKRSDRSNYLTGWKWDRSSGQHIEIPGEWRRWDGLVRIRGKLVYDGTTFATDHRLVGISPDASRMRWNKRLIGCGKDPNAFRRSVIDVKTVERTLFRAADTAINNELALDGFQWFANIPESYWQALTLQNSWAYEDGGSGAVGLASTGDFGTPALYRDQYGVCHLRGIVSGGTTTIFTVVAQLPNDCRPYDHKRIVFPAYSSGGTTAVEVDELGRVRIFSPSSPSATLGLDQVSFRTDPRAEEP